MTSNEALQASPPELATMVNRVAGYLAHGGAAITTGDAAALRRMDPIHPVAAFYKLEAMLAGDGGNWALARDEPDKTWAAIVVGLATLGSLHKPGIRLGRALAAADFSELRFARLLRADREWLVSELPMLARFLRAKLVSTDWSDAARLILSHGRADEDRVRRGLARDYYGVFTAPERD